VKSQFERFLDNVRYLGDAGKAAGKVRASRRTLSQWMNDPEKAAKINEARIDALKNQKPNDIIFRAKIAPELEKDSKFFRETGQRHRESKIIAKLAAKDLKAWRWQILQAANNNDKNFFIDLGKILGGEINKELCDKLDLALIEIITRNPRANMRRIMDMLGKWGIEYVDEGTVRVRKSRLGLTQKRDRRTRPQGHQSREELIRYLGCSKIAD
jgi:hypothetical protein